MNWKSLKPINQCAIARISYYAQTGDIKIMSYKAYFIGGPEDMTKKVVENKSQEVMFYEPIDHRSLALHRSTQSTISCRTAIYEMQCVTEQGVLLYEFSRYES